MEKLGMYGILVSALIAFVQCECIKEDWSSAFYQRGTVSCSNQRLLHGFYREDRADPDIMTSLKEAECCDTASAWKGQEKMTMQADWWTDYLNTWSTCPQGYFLEGLFATEGVFLHNIVEGRCTKPVDHPHYYDNCYNQDIMQCFDSKNWCKCDDGYFVTGFLRGECDELYCLEKLRCCTMASNTETLDELAKVKTRIIEATGPKIALLAHHLGYGNTYGCRGNIGENFYRDGDTWKAAFGEECGDDIDDERLNLVYGDWSLHVKNITYDQVLLEDLDCEAVQTGTIHNRDQNPVTETISLSETVITSVTHTATSSWKLAVELGTSFNFEFFGASYKLSFETQTTETDSNNRQHSETFTIVSDKTLPENSSASWILALTKNRRTIPYKATIEARFSTELQGFLRQGGAFNDDANFHNIYSGSDNYNEFNYRFGDAITSFYTALQQESDKKSEPWMWYDVKNRYSDAEPLIKDLSNENNYVFTLTGEFKVVEGKHAELYWDHVDSISSKLLNKQGMSNSSSKATKYLAKAGPARTFSNKTSTAEMMIGRTTKP